MKILFTLSVFPVFWAKYGCVVGNGNVSGNKEEYLKLSVDKLRQSSKPYDHLGQQYITGGSQEGNLQDSNCSITKVIFSQVLKCGIRKTGCHLCV